MKFLLPFLLSLLTGLGLFTPVYGQEAEEPESYLTPFEDPENYDINKMLQYDEDEFLDFLDAPHELISEGVEGMAQGMDLFFADEKIFTETTKSYARISAQTTFDKMGDSSTTGDLKLKIDLPRTKKKLKLLLESDTDRDIQTGTNQSSTPGQEKESVSLYAALQKEVSKKNEWHTKVSLGMKFRVPLDPFLRIRAYKDFSVADWQIRFTETLFWFNSKGTGASSLLELDYALTHDLLFRSRSSELWTDFLDYHEVEQSFSLYHEITDRRAISYTIGIYGISHPQLHKDRYYASLNYRQRIHRDWLFVDINPALVYESENNFQQERSIIIRLEMVFGNKYVYRQEND